jgi:hypothetical protein
MVKTHLTLYYDRHRLLFNSKFTESFEFEKRVRKYTYLSTSNFKTKKFVLISEIRVYIIRITI